MQPQSDLKWGWCLQRWHCFQSRRYDWRRRRLLRHHVRIVRCNCWCRSQLQLLGARQCWHRCRIVENCTDRREALSNRRVKRRINLCAAADGGAAAAAAGRRRRIGQRSNPTSTSIDVSRRERTAALEEPRSGIGSWLADTKAGGEWGASYLFEAVLLWRAALAKQCRPPLRVPEWVSSAEV